MASLREFGVFTDQQNILPKFRLPSIGQEYPHPLPDPDNDLRRMLDCCRTDMQRALVALLGLEGLRLHEALSLLVDNLDFDEMTIHVIGKGQKTRVIPITERAWQYLAPQVIAVQLAAQRFVLQRKLVPHERQRLVSYSDRGARHFVTDLGVRACISRPVSSHDLRATFATLAYENTKDILLVQGWLGHSDVTTTQGYIAVSLDRMRQAGEF